MKKSFNSKARYLSLLSVFAAVIIVYIVILAKTQIDGSKDSTDDLSVAYTRTYSVSGLRGEIYDRNGKLLVGNDTSYDLVLEYGAIPDTTTELNTSLLELIEAINATGNSEKICTDYYVLEGEYPELSYVDALRYGDSEEYQYFVKILEANRLDTTSTSAQEFVEHMTKKYKLSSSSYTNKEITALLRIRYAMERIKFGIYQPFTIAEDISMDLVSYVEESNIEGATFKISSERRYLYPEYASHILGRLGKIQSDDAEYYSGLGYPMDAYVGTSGCELAFEEYLRGQDGVLEVSYDKDGSVIDKKFIKEPISGDDVYLTIDIELQIAAEDKLKDTILSLPHSDSGAIVALDSNDGGILVMASYPTYDLTQFTNAEYFNIINTDPASPQLNRALNGVYAPGSIYKIGSALAALEQKTITQSTRLNCSGVYPRLHNPTCLGVHGDIGVIDAIGVSCNCFFYEVGYNMGIDAITSYTTRLGLGSSTGVELPEKTGSIAGSLYRTQNGLTPWGQGDDLSAVIGQSDHTYSPLQIGVFISSVVNGGDRYSAHLLHSVKKFYTEETVFEYSPKIIDSVDISGDTYNTLIKGMRNVVTSSASLTNYFSVLDVSVGGKTGTAQVAGKYDYALFSGFAPLDAPEIVSVCVIEQGGNGGNAAIPISALFKEYFDENE